MSTESLWGSLADFKRIKTPLQIVREQGELLTQATQGILKGEVKIISQAQGENIAFSLYIIATRLNQYQYKVLTVDHDIELYPASVWSSIGKEWVECKDKVSFLAIIKAVLSSSEMRRIIESLLSQSES